ncbi:MAG: amylo-alpha-1,6-glucosidase [Elusimicrobiota bacterium]
MTKKLFETKYGYFNEDGTEYVITTPFTPKPWVNIICPNDYGMVISQLGTGYSFYKNPALFRINHWEQDLVKEEFGKFIYVKDEEKLWSVTHKPMGQNYSFYECRHGIGYTIISSEINNIYTELTAFVPPEDKIEVYILKIKNKNKTKKTLNFYSYFEWFLRDVGGNHNEFHKFFIETSCDNNIIFAKKVNSLIDIFSFSSCSIKPASFTTNKENFIGKYGNIYSPQGVNSKNLDSAVGRYVDPVSCFNLEMEFLPEEEKVVVFTVGLSKNKILAKKLVDKYNKEYNQIFDETKKYWQTMLSKTKIETQDKKMDFLTNTWLKYQTISCRINARTGYFQPAGGIGFRDQLQDSLIYLSFNPELTKKQILLHAKHQFSDGTVYHWWHPITETGPRSKHSDTVLWLPFAVLEYLKETNDFSILKEKIEFVDKKEKISLYEHCELSINLVIKRFSKRGLPFIGEGDWNDGLSAVGKDWKGESVWLGHFLHGILNDWVKMCEHLKLDSKNYLKISQRLKENINKYTWDGNWFYAATKDNGEPIGSKNNKEGKIYLNAQTWAIINDIITDEQKIKKMLNSVDKYLYRECGPILLYPAYKKPDPTIGYITEYAPASRENGAVYVHAACWALLMECKLKRLDKVSQIYKQLNTIYCSLEPDKYKTEPYVTCGDIYGPESELFCQGGWSWYTGSAQWLFKVTMERILGIRASYEGLIIDPALPSEFKRVKIVRPFRNTTYNIEIFKDGTINKTKKIYVDGKEMEGDVIPYNGKKKECNVKVMIVEKIINKNQHRRK